VDDHQLVRDALARLITLWDGFEIVGEAGDGRQALERLATVRPDVILLDISMPEMNGITALQQIRRICPTARIIILSASDRGSYVSSALKQGAQGYVLKDHSSDELKEAIATVMRGDVYLAPKVNQMVIQGYVGQTGENSCTSPVDSLSTREREVFQLIAEGCTNADVAEKLNIACKTVENHRHNLMQKLNCTNMAQLIVLAAKEGLVGL